MQLKVTNADGSEHDVTIKASDLVAFERRYDRDWPGDDARIEHVMFVAWNALRRAGDAGDDFDAWLDSGVDFDSAAPVPLGEPGSSQ